jgi:hypothetical protein
MRKPVFLAMAAVIVLLFGLTWTLSRKYHVTAARYDELLSDSERMQDRYQQAIGDIASIQDSLNAILPGVSGADIAPHEEPVTSGDYALARIAVLKAGLGRARQRIQALDDQVRRSGAKAAALQKLVESLRWTLAEKEALIAGLGQKVDSLTAAVTDLESEASTSRDTIRDQARELGTVYVAMGSRRELSRAGVIRTVGGVLGLGRALAPSARFDESRFASIDTDDDRVIEIPAARARVLSAQPESSYRLLQVGGKLQLRILDPKTFRSVRHLVIVTA